MSAEVLGQELLSEVKEERLDEVCTFYIGTITPTISMLSNIASKIPSSSRTNSISLPARYSSTRQPHLGLPFFSRLQAISATYHANRLRNRPRVPSPSSTEVLA